MVGTPVFLDVEGLPDRDFYYLVGIRVEGPGGTEHRFLWADSPADEKRIWEEFLGILSGTDRPMLLHYGSFEKTFLMEGLQEPSARHGKDQRSGILELPAGSGFRTNGNGSQAKPETAETDKPVPKEGREGRCRRTPSLLPGVRQTGQDKKPTSDANRRGSGFR
jgi:hypothetical protein